MTKLIVAIVVALTSTLAQAQLKGSGKTVTKTYDYTNFDKIYFEDIAGKLEVEIGKSWNITVTIDDNLESLLAFKQEPTEQALTISLKDNKKNKMYLEDTAINIKVTLPEASVIRNESNADLTVKGVLGRYFRIENNGNGNSYCSGTIDQLDVEKSGNGDIIARDLKAKKAIIKSAGNGNVVVNVTNKLTAKNSGNGNVKNIGKATFDSDSKSVGNGNLLSQ